MNQQGGLSKEYKRGASLGRNVETECFRIPRTGLRMGRQQTWPSFWQGALRASSKSHVSV